MTLHNLAYVAVISGRFTETELLVERALKLLDLLVPLDDPLRLRPLHLLWSAQSQQGKRGKARQTFQSMRAVRLVNPLNRALFSSAAARRGTESIRPDDDVGQLWICIAQEPSSERSASH